MNSANPLISEGCPEVVANLDLTKPGLFEASAGTGKTYAIEHLVLRLLIENEDLNLQNILVLTYTEKATGELKEKIRLRLAARLDQGKLPTAVAHRLKAALLGFDRAAIYTIHGFCDRILKKYAFENRSLFQSELVKQDREVFREVLREEMRTTWLADTGDGPEGLQAFRNLTQSLGFGANSKWEGKLLHLSQEFNPQRGDKLLPEFDAVNLARLQGLLADVPMKMADLFPDLIPGKEAEHPFILKYRAIKFANVTLKKKGPLVLENALRLATAMRDQNEAARLNASLAFLEAINLNAIHDKTFACLLPGPEESKTPAWPELVLCLSILNEMQKAAAEYAVEVRSRSFAGQRQAIVSLRSQTQAFKREQGIISFNDMIEDVWAALRENPDSIGILRQEYRYCLVDEFQDTDPLQWDIFRTVFLDGPGKNPLYLIGDPKQAIYRFRGGDIHTYMAARATLYDLSRQGLSQGLGLETNFRSSRKMVAACNTLFTQAGWFHSLHADPENTQWRLPSEPDPLGYVTVGHGGLGIQEARETGTHATPIILKDLRIPNGLKKNVVQKKAYAWIAAEISGLMAAPEALRIPDRGSGDIRPLRLNDICILVASKYEKAKVEKACLNAGIPTQVEKQAGLYGGDVAGEYLAVLESLEDIGNPGKHARALLTRFFRYAGEPPAKGLPETVHPLFESWARWAERKRWQKLFQSMLYQTGVLYRAGLEADADRCIMDFIQIGQNLVQAGLRESLTLSSLVENLRDLRAQTGSGDEDQDFHREDSEGGKVTLMTMHVSKGLEFPVVFLAGASPGRPPEYFKYRDGLNTIYHLDTKNDDAKAAHKLETENEERRLYYVALTRARYKLFIPVFPAPSGKSNFGPLGGFVAQALSAAAAAQPDLFSWSGWDGQASSGSSVQTENPLSDLPALPAQPTMTGLSALSVPAALPTDFFSGYPWIRSESQALPDYSGRRRRLSSYSHLVHHTHGLAVETIDGRLDKEEAPVTEALLEEIPEKAEGAERSEPAPSPYPGNALPRGKDIGNMFHEILERIDFSLAASAPDPESLLLDIPTRDLIQERMQDHRLEETWRSGVAEVVWNALRAQLPDPAGDKSFALCEVKDYRPEMEFLFPYPARLDGQGADGYLGGFIDLVFRHRGRYYLLDWKSNHLDGYGPGDLEASMRHSHYDLQYMLYSLALEKWLRSLIPDYSHEAHFGGVYYIYLRGMRAMPAEAGAIETSATGVFALRPTPAQMHQDFPIHLAKVMDASGANVKIDPSVFLSREAGAL